MAALRPSPPASPTRPRPTARPPHRFGIDDLVVLPHIKAGFVAASRFSCVWFGSYREPQVFNALICQTSSRSPFHCFPRQALYPRERALIFRACKQSLDGRQRRGGHEGKVIVFVWGNDEDTRRTHERSGDADRVFRKMLEGRRSRGQARNPRQHRGRRAKKNQPGTAGFLNGGGVVPRYRKHACHTGRRTVVHDYIRCGNPGGVWPFPHISSDTKS